MLFGQKTRPISDFVPRVLAHIDGIDTDMVSSYLMDSVIQFLRDTHLLTEIVCVNLEPCVSSYKVNTNHRITEVIGIRVFVDDRQIPNHKFDMRLVGDVLYTEEVPAYRDYRIEIEVATAPSRDSDLVPDFIYEDWVDAIVSLTLSKLYLLSDNEWYNQSLANTQLALYQQAVRSARFHRVTKGKPFQMRLSNQRRL